MEFIQFYLDTCWKPDRNRWKHFNHWSWFKFSATERMKTFQPLKVIHIFSNWI